MQTSLRWRGGRLIATLLCGIALVGCTTTGPRDVNGAALTAQAVRASESDDVSRMLIQSTFARAKDLSTDYHVGPNDKLVISIFEWEIREQTKEAPITVTESGLISLPVIGDLNVGGKTVSDIKKLIEKALKDGKIIKEPRVSVDIQEFRSKRVAVGGAVNEPGVYTLRQNATTFLDVLSLAGGISDQAGYVAYVIQPPTQSGSEPAPDPNRPMEAQPGLPGMSAGSRVMRIDLYDLLQKGDLSLNPILSNGDLINVPEAKRVSVIGFVREAGSFMLKKPTTVLEAIAMAKGVEDPKASPEASVLKRRTEGGERIMPLDLVAISRGQRPNLYLQANDVIEVRQTSMHKLGLDVLDFVKSVFNVGFAVSN